MPQRTAKDILDAWRELERRRTRFDPADPACASLDAEIALLRREYQLVTAGHNPVTSPRSRAKPSSSDPPPTIGRP
jgi:hypothetical protein